MSKKRMAKKETAKEILTFVLDNTKDIDLLIQSNTFLIKMRIDSAQEQDLKGIETDLNLLLKQMVI